MSDRLLALVLGLATAASRLPFVTTRLWEWDSVLYARALEQGFHVDDVLAGSRPHPPGYLFYVASAGLVHALGADSNAALVAVSVLASGIAAAALYLVCRRFTDRVASALLALAFAASPLAWLHGEVAMPYVLLAPLGAILAATFLAGRGTGARRLALSSLLFGVLAGFRQDVLLFFAPMWLWCLWPASWRARALALGALAVGCAAWFVPSAALSGGPAEYVGKVVRQLVSASGSSPGSERDVALNLAVTFASLWWALLLLAPVVLVLLLARVIPRRHGDPRLGAFFALWLVPPFLFDVFVHIGEWGLALWLVPGLYALLAWLAAPILAGRARSAALAVLALSLAAGAGAFVLGDDPVFSAASLRGHDRATAAKVASIGQIPDAVVVASAEVLVARYYLPGVTVWYDDERSARRYERRLDRPATLVLYEPRARPPGVFTLARFSAEDGTTLETTRIGAGTLVLAGGDIDAPPP